MASSVIGLTELQTGIVRASQGGRIDRGSDSYIYWHPWAHNSIGLFDGSTWVPVSPSGYVYYYHNSGDYGGTPIGPDINYDVYAKFVDESTFSIELVQWATDSTRNEATWKLFEGVRVFDLSDEGKTLRYLGGVRLANDGEGTKFQDSYRRRFVVNWDNPIIKTLRAYSQNTGEYTGNTSWSYGEVWNMLRAEFLCIKTNVSIGGMNCLIHRSDASQAMECAFGYNSTSERTGAAMRERDDSDPEYGLWVAYYGFLYTDVTLGYNWVTSLRATNGNCGIWTHYDVTGLGVPILPC